MRGPRPCSLRHSASRLYSHCWTCCSGRPVSADKMATSEGCMFLFRRKWQSRVDSWSTDNFSDASVDSTSDEFAQVDISTSEKFKRTRQMSEELERRCPTENVTNTGRLLPSSLPFKTTSTSKWTTTIMMKSFSSTQQQWREPPTGTKPANRRYSVASHISK